MSDLPPGTWCQFRIGENNSASLDQLPDFAYLAKYLAQTHDWNAPYALGHLMADAVLKLSRPWPEADRRPTNIALEGLPLGCGVPFEELLERVLPLPPKARAAGFGLLSGIAQFVTLALCHPVQLPGVITRLDALTNDRLTDRARWLWMSGSDPGTSDLWRMLPPDDLKEEVLA